MKQAAICGFREQIICRIVTLLIIVLTLVSAVSAEGHVPSFTAFAGIPETECIRMENPETATLQCRTDKDHAEAYRLLLADYGFLSCGSWTIPSGDAFKYGELNAYILPTEGNDCLFDMEVEPGLNISCHLFFQYFFLPDGSSAVSVTWSQGLAVDEMKTPEPLPVPSPVPTPVPTEQGDEKPCYFCRQSGDCPYCDGKGQIHDYIMEMFVDKDVMKKCEKCNGSGKCPKCDGDGIIP